MAYEGFRMEVKLNVLGPIAMKWDSSYSFCRAAFSLLCAFMRFYVYFCRLAGPELRHRHEFRAGRVSMAGEMAHPPYLS